MTEAEDDPGSRYYRGTIKKLFRGSERGTVLSDTTGKETEFVFQHVIMRGGLHYFDDLREGLRVGFDVGWTSSGLRVTVLYTAPPEASQRQAGAEQQVAADELADRSGEDGDIE